jgi:hypothetical protein
MNYNKDIMPSIFFKKKAAAIRLQKREVDP